MTTIDGPRGRDAAICAAAIAGRSRDDTAEALGCSPTTVDRTRRRWRDHITTQRDERAEEAAAAMLAAVPRAAQRLSELVDSPVPGIALAASRYVMDAALRWRDQTEVENRLQALEDRLGGGRDVWSA